MEHKAIAEAAVVSHPHPVKGECLYCFVTLCDGYTFSSTLTEELKKQSEEPTWADTEGFVLMPLSQQVVEEGWNKLLPKPQTGLRGLSALFPHCLH